MSRAETVEGFNLEQCTKRRKELELELNTTRARLIDAHKTAGMLASMIEAELMAGLLIETIGGTSRAEWRRVEFARYVVRAQHRAQLEEEEAQRKGWAK